MKKRDNYVLNWKMFRETVIKMRYKLISRKFCEKKIAFLMVSEVHFNKWISFTEIMQKPCDE